MNMLLNIEQGYSMEMLMPCRLMCKWDTTSDILQYWTETVNTVAPKVKPKRNINKSNHSKFNKLRQLRLRKLHNVKDVQKDDMKAILSLLSLNTYNKSKPSAE